MKVLVTGSQGYIGTILMPMLVEWGHDATGLDSDLYERCTFDDGMPDMPFIRKDIRDIQFDDISGFEAIIHLAGLSNDPLGDYRPELTEEINQKASIRLAEIAKKAGIQRFLFASSCSTYGAAGDDFLDENASFNPVTPYGISKVNVEAALNQMADDNFCPTYLRASTAYGLSPRIRFDLVTNNLTAWAFTTGKVYLKSDGSPWRPIVHVRDISLAYIAALQAPRALVHNEAFNVGLTSENYQVKEIAEMVREIVPECQLDFAPTAGPDKRNYRVNCDKIASTLHEFKPQWTARKGIQELYNAFQKSGLTLKDFEGITYKRIAHLKKLIEDGLLTENLHWRHINTMTGVA